MTNKSISGTIMIRLFVCCFVICSGVTSGTAANNDNESPNEMENRLSPSNANGAGYLFSTSTAEFQPSAPPVVNGARKGEQEISEPSARQFSFPSTASLNATKNEVTPAPSIQRSTQKQGETGTSGVDQFQWNNLDDKPPGESPNVVQLSTPAPTDATMFYFPFEGNELEGPTAQPVPAFFEFPLNVVQTSPPAPTDEKIFVFPFEENLEESYSQPMTTPQPVPAFFAFPTQAPVEAEAAGTTTSKNFYLPLEESDKETTIPTQQPVPAFFGFPVWAPVETAAGADTITTATTTTTTTTTTGTFSFPLEGSEQEATIPFEGVSNPDPHSSVPVSEVFEFPTKAPASSEHVHDSETPTMPSLDGVLFEFPNAESTEPEINENMGNDSELYTNVDSSSSSNIPSEEPTALPNNAHMQAQTRGPVHNNQTTCSPGAHTQTTTNAKTDSVQSDITSSGTPSDMPSDFLSDVPSDIPSDLPTESPTTIVHESKQDSNPAPYSGLTPEIHFDEGFWTADPPSTIGSTSMPPTTSEKVSESPTSNDASAYFKFPEKFSGTSLNQESSNSQPTETLEEWWFGLSSNSLTPNPTTSDSPPPQPSINPTSSTRAPSSSKIPTLSPTVTSNSTPKPSRRPSYSPTAATTNASKKPTLAPVIPTKPSLSPTSKQPTSIPSNEPTGVSTETTHPSLPPSTAPSLPTLAFLEAHLLADPIPNPKPAPRTSSPTLEIESTGSLSIESTATLSKALGHQSHRVHL